MNLGTREGAAAALETLGNAANQLSQNRAELGAQQNRLASAIETERPPTSMLQNSESMIRDQDMARGVIDRTRNDDDAQAQYVRSRPGQHHPAKRRTTLGNVTPGAPARPVQPCMTRCPSVERSY